MSNSKSVKFYEWNIDLYQYNDIIFPVKVLCLKKLIPPPIGYTFYETVHMGISTQHSIWTLKCWQLLDCTEN